MTSSTSRLLLTLLTLLLTFSAPALAQQQQITIFDDPKDGWDYHGCYNETTGLEGTTGERALYGGKNQVKPGEMTVQMCLAFCKEGDKDSVYKYAGLEFATECWCASALSGLSAKLDDNECNLPCDGDKSQACGGALKLTVYIAGAASLQSMHAMWVAGLAVAFAVALI